MRAKKGQFEILGLTFVVFLVLLGVVFGMYVVSKPQRQLAREFGQSQLASNWLNTYKGTTTNCHNATVTRLLSDCALAEQITCPGGVGSCAYVREITKNFLDATMGKWSKEYNFSIQGPGDVSSITFSNGSCVNKNIQRDEQPIPTGAGTIFLKLAICG